MRVVTLPYSEGLKGFSDEALQAATCGCEVLEVRDHFFVHGGVPHLALVLTMAGHEQPRRGSPPSRNEDPARSLPEDLLPLYRSLRQWRNERARQDGIPNYLILRNAQIAEICLRKPTTLAALREIEGIGESTCKKYGAELLRLLSPEGVAGYAAPTDAGGEVMPPSGEVSQS